MVTNQSTPLLGSTLSPTLLNDQHPAVKRQGEVVPQWGGPQLNLGRVSHAVTVPATKEELRSRSGIKCEPGKVSCQEC
jgi:hypothetical protein